MKLSILLGIFATVLASTHGKANTKLGLIDYYDCTGKTDGNYEHPSDCTKFIMCSNEYAYEFDCPDCHLSDGPDRCPAGKLHFSKELDRCEWANVANCRASTPITDPTTTEQAPPSTEDSTGPEGEPTESDTPTAPEVTTAEPTTVDPTTAESTPTAETTSPQPTTEETTTPQPTTAEPTTVDPTTAEPTTVDPTTAEPTTEEPTTVDPTTAEPTTVDPTTPPPENDRCDPLDCKHEGSCTRYRFCNKNTSTWQNEVCTDGLFWNPDLNRDETDGLGGSCDFWENLSNETRDSYENDLECFPPCYYIGDGNCSPNYIFHPAETEHRNLISLTCPSSLIWNQAFETCDYSENVEGCSEATTTSAPPTEGPTTEDTTTEGTIPTDLSTNEPPTTTGEPLPTETTATTEEEPIPEPTQSPSQRLKH